MQWIRTGAAIKTGVMLARMSGPTTGTAFPSVFGQLRSGLLRPIAVTGETRSSIFPELPTIAASGVPGYTAVVHYGMVAAAGTDRAIVDGLNSELRAALNNDDVRARIAEEGGEALPGAPDQQANDMEQEEAKWGALVRRLGIRSE
jgi:tripartite-type tricarboxylate transporter receptor subunit TctC